MKVSDMDTTHIERSIAKIERSRTGWRKSYLGHLQAELFIRKAREASR